MSRIALAPIRDSSLNISSPSKSPSGLKRSYTSPSLPLTPNGKHRLSQSHFPHQPHHLQAQTFGAGSAQLQKYTTPKSLTDTFFNDQNLTPNSTSTSPGGSDFLESPDSKTAAAKSLSSTPDRSATASLAATKLKLKLQLAIYKLQKKGLVGGKLASNKNNKISKSYIAASINLNLKSLTSASNSHITKPSNTFGSSSNKNNTNLTSLPTLKKKKPSLSATAYDKNLLLFRNSQKLKLYSIKKDSKFYADKKDIPLEPRTVDSRTEQHQFASTSSPATTFATFPPSVKTKMVRSLPPINKILKTPLKATTRNLVNPYLPHDKRYKLPYNNTDETIDEDDDGPIKESTSNSIKVAGKDNLLSSSPIQANSFGTPNSFSVAKSLLQLGSGFYN
ncbi:hypothetical protein CLIB1423_40S00188 [[Candida] railenensis]|uniref:Uncharacterized protein n=1 Tax=[Candida] railenensis TaxID=45579 RepID=A0A9P0W1S2_9ASCO|nr:hypothetical protein CLIB1423_40S00188 [[Candida] railenensis]